MKKLTALFCLAAMVLLLFSGCSSSGGAESAFDLIDAFYDAASKGNKAALHDLFAYDHFPSRSQISPIESNLHPGDTCVVYYANDLSLLPFYGERISVCIDKAETGQNRNDAELQWISQTMYEESGIDVALQENVWIEAQYVIGTDSYNDYIYCINHGTEDEKAGISEPYELTFDTVRIDGRYYIRSVTFQANEFEAPAQKSSTTTIKAQAAPTAGGLTLDEVKANYNGTAMGNGFYIKKGDLFYPCAVGGFVTGTGPIFEVVTSGDNVPRLDQSAGDQLVCFAPFTITSLPVAASEYHGKTIPVCLSEKSSYASDYIEITLVPDYSLYNLQKDKIDTHIQKRSDREEIESFFRDMETEFCVMATITDTSSYDEFLDHYWSTIGPSLDEMETLFVGYYDSDYSEEITYIFSCLEDAEVPLEYYVGSQYKHVTLPAIIDYWCTPLDNVYNVPLSTTKDGYYIVDTESMERGTYTIYDSALTNWSDYTYQPIDEHHGYYDDWAYENNLYYENATIFSVQ